MLPDGAERDFFFVCVYFFFSFLVERFNDLTVSQEVHALVAKARNGSGDRVLMKCC